MNIWLFFSQYIFTSTSLIAISIVSQSHPFIFLSLGNFLTLIRLVNILKRNMSFYHTKNQSIKISVDKRKDDSWYKFFYRIPHQKQILFQNTCITSNDEPWNFWSWRLEYGKTGYKESTGSTNADFWVICVPWLCAR